MEENELVGQSKDSNSNNNKPTLNIFQIMDEIVRQLNKTKKMFLIMIVSVIVVVPLTFIVTFALIGGPSFWNDGPPGVGPGGDDADGGGPPDSYAFGIARGIVIAFLLAWIVVGIRQWFVLSKWTQRYEIYKELQKKIDEKLDYERGENNKEKEEEEEK
jgi:cell division protein FtsL